MSGNRAARQSPLRKKSRKIRAAEKAASRWYDLVGHPDSPAAEGSARIGLPANYKLGKPVKMWHEPKMPPGVPELIALIDAKAFVLLWNGMYRQWELWEPEKRWQTGVLPTSIPYNAPLKRWRYEFGRILDSRIKNAA